MLLRASGPMAPKTSIPKGRNWKGRFHVMPLSVSTGTTVVRDGAVVCEVEGGGRVAAFRAAGLGGDIDVTRAVHVHRDVWVVELRDDREKDVDAGRSRPEEFSDVGVGPYGRAEQFDTR